ncbi:MAG: hypothetical protein J5965_03645, partial [Aeriscardovia sp.]|nr:hypothetical protein [Aeriscardovia sp.]
GQCLPRTSRGNSMIASLASSHTQEEQQVQKLKSTPRQPLARADQKNNQNILKGYLMTSTIGLRQTQRPAV